MIAGKSGKEATHSGGKGELFHDWFPYLEGFSPNFVYTLINTYFPEAKLMLEPFAGVGTTPISLAQIGISTSYCEVNPVLQHLIKSKALILTKKLSKEIASEINSQIFSLPEQLSESKEDEVLRITYSNCFKSSKYFEDKNFSDVLKLKSIERSLAKTELQNYFSIAVYSSLLESSLLRRAGDVRFKTQKELAKGTPRILDLVIKKLSLIRDQINEFESTNSDLDIKLISSNAKMLSTLRPIQADGVITSPPYLNGTNYFRNTRLELWYREEINIADDLRVLRNQAITAGINDVSKLSGKIVLDEARAYYDQILKVCYDSRIPKMIAAYFNDMKVVFLGIQKNVRHGGIICIDIGDSIYSDVHIPTHQILSDIAISIGWSPVDEIILRQRFSNNGTKLTQRLLVFKNA